MIRNTKNLTQLIVKSIEKMEQIWQTLETMIKLFPDNERTRRYFNCFTFFNSISIIIHTNGGEL